MKLYLEPTAGLANRMRAIVSGIGLSLYLDCDLEIIWKKREGLNCSFHDLFQPLSEAKTVSKNFRTDFLKKFRKHPQLHKQVAQVLGFGFTMYDYNMPHYVWSTETKQLNTSLIANRNKDVYINSSNEFWFQPQLLKQLIPVESVQNAVEATSRKFNHTIGLHIRRTDHKTSIANSPIDTFEKDIESEIDHFPDATFYLATDDQLVKEYLDSKYPNRIISNNVPLYRNTKQGMVGAMIDLYCLARTKKIYGSYGSSYSDFAARIGGIPLVVSGKKSQG